MENPLNEDGTPYFINEETEEPEEMFSCPNGDGGHFNAFFVDNNTKIVAMGGYGLNSVSNIGTSVKSSVFLFPILDWNRTNKPKSDRVIRHLMLDLTLVIIILICSIPRYTILK
ncbi:MAG: hypothetical protein K8S23_10875 [Candidatus Cloacimonetes bacterium]|nr:hypothetical protein [Candidatus Cloacimonadota bacterium]